MHDRVFTIVRRCVKSFAAWLTFGAVVTIVTTWGFVVWTPPMEDRLEGLSTDDLILIRSMGEVANHASVIIGIGWTARWMPIQAEDDRGVHTPYIRRSTPRCIQHDASATR